MGLTHNEQPGLELALVTLAESAPQVVPYGEGLEHDPSKPFTVVYSQNPYGIPGFTNHQGYNYGAATYAPYRQSAYLSSIDSGWSPSNQGVAMVGGSSSPEKLSHQRIIWGLPRKRLCIIMGAASVVVLVAALALGLGLGLGLRKSRYVFDRFAKASRALLSLAGYD